jgi:H+/Cl- antiporter ClcA
MRSKIYKALSSVNDIKWSIAGKSLLCGVVSGLLVVLYRLVIEFGTDTAVEVYAHLRQRPLLILPWILLIILAGLFIAWLVKLEPMAKGSGIPQVEGIVVYGLRIKWYSVLIVRFVGGFLASLFGLSLGREGPSIQIGAAGSQAVAKKISKNKLEENYLITGGAAAGLSAAFNAPLSGIVFALEEVHRSFSPLILIAATTASLVSDVVSKYFFGLKPVLSFASTPPLPAGLYVLMIPLGIVSGLIGVVTNKGLLGFQSLYGKLPKCLRPMIALLLAVPCGLLLPQVLGGGQHLIQMAESGSAGLVMLLVILAVKLIFTCTSFGSGVPGGIFLPILSSGALIGGAFGLIAVHFGMPKEYVADFAVCAMAGALSSAVKAPVTSILLTVEMTGSLVHMLPVAACSFIAMLLSDLLKVTPIYEALLERIVNQDEHANKNDKAGGLVEVSVEYGSAAAGRKVSEVDWPEGSLIVNIHRGDKVIVPRGNTEILPGDYLVIMTSELKFADINTYVRSICYAPTYINERD